MHTFTVSPSLRVDGATLCPEGGRRLPAPVLNCSFQPHREWTLAISGWGRGMGRGPSVSQRHTRLLARLFQPVQYGQKPEGRTVAFPSVHPPRTAASAAATAAPQGHVRGRPPIATFSANPDAKGRPRVLMCPR